MNEKNIAIMGATGAVGLELIKLLAERTFPVKNIKLLSSKRSAGKNLNFKGENITVQELSHDSFKGIDICFASAGGAISKEFVPSAIKADAVVIDNTSYYRMNSEVPLVIPEINPQAIKNHQGIISNPNCSTIIMLMALWPLQQLSPIKRVIVSTYQAASGAGKQAMDELLAESEAKIKGEDYQLTVIPHPYAFNLFPHNSDMQENGYCQEENKMINETKKILSKEHFRLSATCVRVPVLRAHSESINVEFDQPINLSEAYKALEQMPGLTVFENKKNNRWPMPIDASNKDEVLVGRLRKDISNKNSIEMWVVGDQIRKGAALNAVQIAEKLL